MASVQYASARHCVRGAGNLIIINYVARKGDIIISLFSYNSLERTCQSRSNYCAMHNETSMLAPQQLSLSLYILAVSHYVYPSFKLPSKSPKSGNLNYMQVNEKMCNLEREYRDCMKSRRDKIRITRHIMMHKVLYNVHVTLFVGQLHNI